MAPVTQSIPNLSGGVSQVPPALRDPASVSELVDAIASPTRGLHSRPPTRFAAVLAPLVDNLDTAFVKELEFSDTDRYLLVLSDGSCRLFHADTGAEQTVIVPTAVEPYLEEASPELSAFDVLPVGRDVFILNRTKVVALGSGTAAARTPEALVYVRAGDFSTTYILTVDNTTVSYKTPSGDGPDKREFIATDYIAQQLEVAFLDTPLAPQFTVAREGNVLYLKRVDEQDFAIKTSDGLGGDAALVIKGSVLSEDDLPLALPTAADGFVVRVPGPNPSGEGAYWLKLDDGRWVETLEPGIRNALDPATMPHVLRRGGAVIESVEHASRPTEPTVQQAAPDAVDLAAAGTDPVTVRFDTETIETDPIPQYDNTTWSTKFYYNIQCPPTPSTTITVFWESSPNGSSWTTRATDVITGPDFGWKSFNLALPSNTRWRVRLSLTDPFYSEFSLTLYRTFNGAPAITVSNTRVVKVTYQPAALFPAGTTLTLNINGNDVDHPVVTSGGETGSAVASALVTAVNAAAISGVTASTGEAGEVILTGASLAPTTVASNDFDPTTTLYDPTANFTPDALIGRTVESIADGSTAVITDNGVNTITVGAWSGLSSEFKAGYKYKVRYSDTEWVLSQAPWEARLVGNETSAPGPSFVGRAVTALFAHDNRLGLAAGDGLVLSSSKSFYRFFRESSRQVNESDVVDVRSRAKPGEVFRHAFSWNGQFYLSTERTQFRLDGSTPSTVALRVVSELPVSRRCAPAVVGTRLYLAAERDGYTQVSELYAVGEGQLVAYPLTADLPHYLEGSPLKLVGDSGILVLVTDTGSNRYLWSAALSTRENGGTFAAWGKWTIPEPVTAAMVGGNCLLIAARPGGFFLEVMDLLEKPQDFKLLDAQVSVVGVFGGVNTTWTLPYSSNASGAINIRLADGTVLTLAQTGTTLTAAGDLSGAALVGYGQTTYVELSPFRLRGQDGQQDRRGRLVLNRVRFTLDRSGSPLVTIERPGRSSANRDLSGSATVEREVNVPVLANAEGTTLTLTSFVEPMTVVGLEWDGDFTPRTSRV